MLAALGHLQTLLVPPRWGCISPKRTTHMGQMSLVLSEIPPFMQSLERVKKSPVRFLPPALLLQSLAPAFSSTPGDPPAPPPKQPWLLGRVAAGPVEAAAPWPVVASDAQRRRDAAAERCCSKSILPVSLPFAIPSPPSSASLGWPFPTLRCRTLPPSPRCRVRPSSPWLPVAVLLRFSCFFSRLPPVSQAGNGTVLLPPAPVAPWMLLEGEGISAGCGCCSGCSRSRDIPGEGVERSRRGGLRSATALSLLLLLAGSGGIIVSQEP